MMKVIYQDRNLQLFHGGYLSIGIHPAQGIQFTPEEARWLSAALDKWALEEEFLFPETYTSEGI